MSALQAIDHMKWDIPGVLSILELYYKSWRLDKCVNFCWIPSHIGIVGNERVDKAAKAATQVKLAGARVPFSDFRQLIEDYFYRIWQEE